MTTTPPTGAPDRRYRAGGLGDVAVKRRRLDVLEAVPIRGRRAEIDRARVEEVRARGTERGRTAAARTLADGRAAMGLLRVYTPRE